MGRSLEDRLKAELDEKKRWFEDRARAVANAANLEARGRQVYADAIRTGRNVLARTPQEIRALGRLASDGDRRALAITKPTAHPPAASQPHQAAPKAAPRPAAGAGVMRQGQAGLSGAVDEFTFGLADRGLAAADALSKGGVAGFGDRYAHEMATKRAEDAYDEAHYGGARNVGRAVGFAGSLAATGGFGLGGVAAKGAAGAARLVGAANTSQRVLKLGGVTRRLAETVSSTKRVANLSGKGLTTLAAGGGAASGIAGQAVTDAMSGRRGGVGDYVGAGLGGAVGGLAMRAGLPLARSGASRERSLAGGVGRALRDPRLAGAVEGSATAAFQALANGGIPTPMEVAEAARGGAIGARFGDLIGKYGSNALPSAVKGQLGEYLSVLKTRAGGEGHPLYSGRGPEFDARMPGAVDGPGIQQDVYLSKGKTIADHVTRDGTAVEAKFGRWADLTTSQKLARKELTDRYRIDHWLPSDIGRAAGAGVAALGPAAGQWAPDGRTRW
jgi:hypothetical protein